MTAGGDAIVARAQARVGGVLQQKWRLDQLIGLGGMAAIYAATNRYGKRAAVKILFPEYSADETTRARFLREGYAANAVQHRGVVQVLDDDIDESGSAYLVMELLEGVTLEALFERNGNRMSPQEVVRYMDQLLDVLARAHARGIVHRDIKPDNLFLTRSGVLKVLDFGIARIQVDERGKKTTGGGNLVLGTPAFMSPEQARARGDLVDGRTDLWSVGATMYYLLSGRFVHEAPTAAEIVIKAATEPAQPLAQVTRNVPPALCAVVDRALALAKERRWPDAQTMRGALRACGASLGLSDMRAALRAEPEPQEPDTLSGSGPEAQQLKAAAEQVRNRLVVLRKQMAELEQRIDGARHERTVIVRRHREQNKPRTPELQAAVAQFREGLAEFGLRVSEDPSFGENFAASREHVARLLQAIETRAHRAAVYETALTLFDEAAIARGRTLLVVLVVAAALLLSLPLLALR
jgi:serine/threonine-protein kinase